MKKFISTLLFIFASFVVFPLHAQIGYQVALLNTATGEPQANKTVNVNITITNAENEVVHTEIQTATTNDFGILSLSVGKEDTFKNADWNKLPFYIAVSADGTLIGKSQILTVPVAEYAKTAGPVLTKDMLVGTWGNDFTIESNVNDKIYINRSRTELRFNADGTWNVAIDMFSDRPLNYNGTYEILGNHILLYCNIGYGLWDSQRVVTTSEDSENPYTLIWSPTKNKIMGLYCGECNPLLSKLTQ